MNTAQPIIMPITGEIVQEIAGIENEDILLKAPFTSSFDPVIGVGNGTHTRTGTAVGIDTDGKYYIAAADQARVNGNTGYFSGPQVTNYGQNYNANPDASLTNVSVSGAASITRQSDTADLATANLDRICTDGNVFEYINTTGASQTITITGQCGSVAEFTGAVRAHVSGGTVTMQFTGGTGATSVTSSDYSKTVFSATTLATTDQLQFVVPDGVTFRWVLNELLKGGPEIANLPLIITEGVATTVYPDAGSVVSAGNIDGDEGWLEFKFTPTVDSTDMLDIHRSVVSTNASSDVSVIYMHSAVGTFAWSDGINSSAGLALLAAGVESSVILRWSLSNNYCQILIDGTPGYIKPFAGWPLTSGLIEIMKGSSIGLSGSIKDLNIYSNLITEAEAIARQT